MPRGIDLGDVSKGKTCPKCQIFVPPEGFHKTKSRMAPGGLSVYCKKCSYARHNEWRLKNKAHCAKASKKWRDANPELAKDHIRKSTYKLPLGTYDHLLAEQQGRCAICETDKPGGRGAFHVDHCHSTGVVRGLLCHHCNLALGHLKDDPALLLKAIAYLAKGGAESGSAFNPTEKALILQEHAVEAFPPDDS